jgi:hypothetical protein
VTESLTLYPWLVLEDATDVLAYAYGWRHRPRAAYQWSVETSVYVDSSMEVQPVELDGQLAAAEQHAAGRRVLERLDAGAQIAGPLVAVCSRGSLCESTTPRTSAWPPS